MKVLPNTYMCLCDPSIKIKNVVSLGNREGVCKYSTTSAYDHLFRRPICWAKLDASRGAVVHMRIRRQRTSVYA